MRNDQPEHRLQHWCCKLLDQIVIRDVPCWWTAVDTGTPLFKQGDESQRLTARFAWENNRKYMGIKPHHLDLYVYQKPIFAQIELKAAASETAARKAVTNGQRDTMTALTGNCIPNELAWSIRSFHAALVRIGFRLHGNAETVVQLFEARHVAAQDAAEIKAEKPRKVSRPRAAKPTAAAIARSVARQGRVRH